ncbi:MAG: hypothetical protein LBM25_06020 [Bacteroidales bacterium]|jgi:hypothetical protein|nr:hypothetical protein [Bacteroidales bacterium]
MKKFLLISVFLISFSITSFAQNERQYSLETSINKKQFFYTPRNFISTADFEVSIIPYLNIDRLYFGVGLSFTNMKWSLPAFSHIDNIAYYASQIVSIPIVFKYNGYNNNRLWLNFFGKLNINSSVSSLSYDNTIFDGRALSVDYKFPIGLSLSVGVEFSLLVSNSTKINLSPFVNYGALSSLSTNKKTNNFLKEEISPFSLGLSIGIEHLYNRKNKTKHTSNETILNQEKEIEPRKNFFSLEVSINTKTFFSEIKPIFDYVRITSANKSNYELSFLPAFTFGRFKIGLGLSYWELNYYEMLQNTIDKERVIDYYKVNYLGIPLNINFNIYKYRRMWFNCFLNHNTNLLIEGTKNWTLENISSKTSDYFFNSLNGALRLGVEFSLIAFNNLKINIAPFASYYYFNNYISFDDVYPNGLYAGGLQGTQGSINFFDNNKPISLGLSIGLEYMFR